MCPIAAPEQFILDQVPYASVFFDGFRVACNFLSEAAQGES
jgi:hypothetical protein